MENIITLVLVIMFGFSIACGKQKGSGKQNDSPIPNPNIAPEGQSGTDQADMDDTEQDATAETAENLDTNDNEQVVAAVRQNPNSNDEGDHEQVSSATGTQILRTLDELEEAPVLQSLIKDVDDRDLSEIITSVSTSSTEPSFTPAESEATTEVDAESESTLYSYSLIVSAAKICTDYINYSEESYQAAQGMEGFSDSLCSNSVGTYVKMGGCKVNTDAVNFTMWTYSDSTVDLESQPTPATITAQCDTLFGTYVSP